MNQTTKHTPELDTTDEFIKLAFQYKDELFKLRKINAELLEACKRLLEICQCAAVDGGDQESQKAIDSDVSFAKAAIAKATA